MKHEWTLAGQCMSTITAVFILMAIDTVRQTINDIKEARYEEKGDA